MEKYPPMLTKRYHCTAVYAKNALIVAGGVSNRKNVATVEILNVPSQQWSTVSSLPTPAHQPSMSICGEFIYLHDTDVAPEDKYCIVKCSLFALAFSNPKPVIWDEVASLPVKGSTLVTVKGHLLAVGGASTVRDRSKEICQYSPDTDSWQVISEMQEFRSHCAAVLLSYDKLLIVGGTYYGHQLNELATIL